MNVCYNVNPKKKGMLINPVHFGKNLVGSYKTPQIQKIKTSHITSSSRTSITKSSSKTNNSNIILALTEGRGLAKGVVGIAAIDVNKPTLILSQINDAQNYINTLTKIHIINPIQILIPSTFTDVNQANQLYLTVREYFPKITITTIPRREFVSSQGLQYISELCAPAFESVLLVIKHKYYATSACCSLLRYIEHTRHIIYRGKSIKVEYLDIESKTLIDIDTAIRLGLVENTNEENLQKNTLLSILDYCCTAVGKNELRTNILQPFCSEKEIESRFDCIQEFLEKPHLQHNLKEILVKLFDVDHILMFGIMSKYMIKSTAPRQLNYILHLKNTISCIEPLCKELSNTSHPEFKLIYDNLKQFPVDTITNMIKEVIQDEAKFAKGQAGITQRCFAIKTGINELLDISRKCYTKLIDNMRNYVEALGTFHNLPLQLVYNNRKGYHLKILTNKRKTIINEEIPKEFIQIEKRFGTITTTTYDLIHFDRRIKNILYEIQKISNKIIIKLLRNIEKHISYFYIINDNIAKLDILQSLATVAHINQHSYIRPSFSSYMELENSKHPILDQNSDNNVIGNSVFASEFYNFNIITGPNMSGKSILIHQIILIQIMAQIGCYIPATKSTLRIANRIFARIGQEDDLHCNASTFLVEMRELNYIFNNLTENSLIAMDELCRSTSNDEGTSLAYAFCEYLLQTKAFVFFTTHSLFLTKLADIHLNVLNWHLETLEKNNDENELVLEYTYCLKPGVTSLKNYGIKLAKLNLIPDLIIYLAEEIVKILNPSYQDELDTSSELKLRLLRYKTTVNLHLLQTKDQLTKEKYDHILKEFQEETGCEFEPINIQNNYLLANKDDDDFKNDKLIYHFQEKDETKLIETTTNNTSSQVQTESSMDYKGKKSIFSDCKSNKFSNKSIDNDQSTNIFNTVNSKQITDKLNENKMLKNYDQNILKTDSVSNLFENIDSSINSSSNDDQRILNIIDVSTCSVSKKSQKNMKSNDQLSNLIKTSSENEYNIYNKSINHNENFINSCEILTPKINDTNTNTASNDKVNVSNLNLRSEEYSGSSTINDFNKQFTTGNEKTKINFTNHKYFKNDSVGSSCELNHDTALLYDKKRKDNNLKRKTNNKNNHLYTNKKLKLNERNRSCNKSRLQEDLSKTKTSQSHFNNSYYLKQKELIDKFSNLTLNNPSNLKIKSNSKSNLINNAEFIHISNKPTYKDISNISLSSIHDYNHFSKIQYNPILNSTFITNSLDDENLKHNIDVIDSKNRSEKSLATSNKIYKLKNSTSKTITAHSQIKNKYVKENNGKIPNKNRDNFSKYKHDENMKESSKSQILHNENEQIPTSHKTKMNTLNTSQNNSSLTKTITIPKNNFGETVINNLKNKSNSKIDNTTTNQHCPKIIETFNNLKKSHLMKNSGSIIASDSSKNNETNTPFVMSINTISSITSYISLNNTEEELKNVISIFKSTTTSKSLFQSSIISKNSFKHTKNSKANSFKSLEKPNKKQKYSPSFDNSTRNPFVSDSSIPTRSKNSSSKKYTVSDTFSTSPGIINYSQQNVVAEELKNMSDSS